MPFIKFTPTVLLADTIENSRKIYYLTVGLNIPNSIVSFGINIFHLSCTTAHTILLPNYSTKNFGNQQLRPKALGN